MRDRGSKGRLAVIDVTDRPDVYVGLGPVKFFFFCHGIFFVLNFYFLDLINVYKNFNGLIRAVPHYRTIIRGDAIVSSGAVDRGVFVCPLAYFLPLFYFYIYSSYLNLA